MATKASKFLKTTRITTKMMYRTYIKTYPDSLIAKEKNYNLFKTIVTECHKEAVDECLRGGQYHFGNEIGLLEVNKYERKFRLDKDGKVLGMAVDFGATRKNKAAGNSEVIYHTNAIIFKWKWANKPETGWLLAVTDGPIGIARKLARYIKENENAGVNYKETFQVDS